MEGQKQEGYQETAFGEYKRKVVECLMKDEGLLGHYLGHAVVIYCAIKPC